MEEFIQSSVALLAICNPVGNAAVFLAMTSDLSAQDRRHAALQATLAVLAILVVSALVGRWILELFSISIAAFRVAGGLVIVLMSLEMLQGQPSQMQHDGGHGGAAGAMVVPFAMPLVAGPGAIAAVITLAVTHAPTGVPFEAVGAAVVTAILVYAVLWLVSDRAELLSPRSQRLATRFMGLILVAVGMQIGLEGLTEFLDGQTSPP